MAPRGFSENCGNRQTHFNKIHFHQNWFGCALPKTHTLFTFTKIGWGAFLVLGDEPNSMYVTHVHMSKY